MNFFIIFFLFNSIKALKPQQQHEIENEYLNLMFKSSFITNITVLVGETVLLNCSLKSQDSKQKNSNFLENSFHLASLTTLNPTWLKADGKYDQSGEIIGFKSENIIVTRKGVIVDVLRDKVKLVGLNDKIQSLKLNEVGAKDEGKYICREFNSENDKIFFLKVYGM